MRWQSNKFNCPIASTSVKIEIAKCPEINRIITYCQAEARGMKSEYEYNNGKCLGAVPGFSAIGSEPAIVKANVCSHARRWQARLYSVDDIVRFELLVDRHSLKVVQ